MIFYENEHSGIDFFRFSILLGSWLTFSWLSADFCSPVMQGIQTESASSGLTQRV